MKYYCYVTILALLVMITSCKKKETLPLDVKKRQLINIADNGGKAAFESFQDSCKALQKYVELFIQNPNEDNLYAVKNNWRAALLSFKRCELYEVNEVKSSYLYFRIHRWPVNIAKLTDTLSGTTTVNNAYIEQLGSDIIGLGAIEYLLYQADASETISTFINNQRKCAYLSGLASYLVQNAVQLKIIWDASRAKFVNATESSLYGSQNQLFNSMLASVQKCVKMRLGSALGDKNSGIVNIQALEAFRSKESEACLSNCLLEVDQCFNGTYPGSASEEEQVGFSDYLITLNQQDLVDRFNERMKACTDELSEIDDLQASLQYDVNEVKRLQERIRDLEILIKVDLASAIGATVTVNDNDGD